MGASGSAGNVDFPTHMKDIHKQWFDWGTVSGSPVYGRSMYDLIDLYTKDAALNPFVGTTYTPPASFIALVNTELDEFDAKVDALVPNTDLTSAFTRAVAEADTLNVLKAVNISGIATDTLSAVNTALASINLGTISSDAITATNTAISTAITQTIAAVDDTVVAAAVTEFYNKNQLQQGRIIRRYAQGMADVNAVQSSAFFFGMAILEAENSRQTAEYSTQLRVQLHRDVLMSYVDIYKTQLANGIEKAIRTFVPIYQTNMTTRGEVALREKTARDELVRQAIGQWIQLLYNNVNASQAVVDSFRSVKLAQITAQREYDQDTMDQSEKMAEWYFRVYQYGGSLFGAINGSSAVVPSRPTKGQSALAGFASGAATGAAIGGPKGAVIGGIIGGLGGYLS